MYPLVQGPHSNSINIRWSVHNTEIATILRSSEQWDNADKYTKFSTRWFHNHKMSAFNTNALLTNKHKSSQQINNKITILSIGNK